MTLFSLQSIFSVVVSSSVAADILNTPNILHEKKGTSINIVTLKMITSQLARSSQMFLGRRGGLVFREYCRVSKNSRGYDQTSLSVWILRIMSKSESMIWFSIFDLFSLMSLLFSFNLSLFFCFSSPPSSFYLNFLKLFFSVVVPLPRINYLLNNSSPSSVDRPKDR